MATTNCMACGAPIFWGRTEDGQMLKLNSGEDYTDIRYAVIEYATEPWTVRRSGHVPGHTLHLCPREAGLIGE